MNLLLLLPNDMGAKSSVSTSLSIFFESTSISYPVGSNSKYRTSPELPAIDITNYLTLQASCVIYPLEFQRFLFRSGLTYIIEVGVT
jgi:hypothetical protein